LHLLAGQKIEGLSSILKYFETAVTSYELGSESEILSLWSETSRDYIAEQIQYRKNSGDWPNMRFSPIGPNPQVIALLPTTEAAILYYNLDSYMRVVAITGDGLTDKYGLTELSNWLDGRKDIFRNPLFEKIVIDSYFIK
jgi:hypothetical protein